MSFKENLEKQEGNKQDILNRERDERCLPIALAVIKMFGALETQELLSQNKARTFEVYSGISQEILALMLERNLPVGEFGYVNQLVLKGLEEVSTIVTESLNKHLRTLQEKTFGGPMVEMPMQELHEHLLRDTLKE